MSKRISSRSRIIPVDYRAIQRVPGQWELEILWRFENQSRVPRYILLDRALTTTIADPLILNHAPSEPAFPVGVNIKANFEIIIVPPGATRERWLRYHLALPEALKQTTVIGRFGHIYAPPDSAWVKNQNRMEIARWQQIADSEALLVRFGKQS